MTEPEIAAEITAIVRGVLGQPALELHADTAARDVPGWDSVRMVEIILQTEERFGIALRSREIDGLRHFGDLVRVVHGKLA